MKKPKLLVPAMYAREMIDSPDLDRLLASGSYVVATRPKKPTDVTKRQRLFRQRRLAAGYRSLGVLLEEDIYSALLAARKDGESLAALIKRLLLLYYNINSISMVETDK